MKQEIELKIEEIIETQAEEIINQENIQQEITIEDNDLEEDLEEAELITVEIEKGFTINLGNYDSIKHRYVIKRESKTKNPAKFLRQTDKIVAKKANEEFNRIKESLAR
jgi:hypothetical protein